MARGRGRCRAAGLLWRVCVPLLLAACSPPRPLPNILLIVVDTLRVDRLGYGGSSRGLTPFLDELAEGIESPEYLLSVFIDVVDSVRAMNVDGLRPPWVGDDRHVIVFILVAGGGKAGKASKARSRPK